MMRLDISFKYLVFVVTAIQGYEFPATFERCHLTDKDFENCLARTIQNAFQLIGSSGISSLGIPSIDPLQITSIEIGAGVSAVNLVQKYNNAKVYGFSKLKVAKAQFVLLVGDCMMDRPKYVCDVEGCYSNNLSIGVHLFRFSKDLIDLDLDKKIFSFTAIYPEIKQEAKYIVDGKILVIPVHGAGDSVIRLGEPKFVHTVFFKENAKNGKKYFHVEDYKLDITVKSAHYDFRNLFDGDKKLSDNFLKVINENWNIIFEDVKGGVENAYSIVLKAIAGRFFDSVPIDDIFLK